MASEPYTVSEVKAEIRNAIRNGLKGSAHYKWLQNRLFQAARRELKKDTTSMPISNADEIHRNMITYNLRKTNKAKKEFLSHTHSHADLAAAKYIWNNPEKLQYVGNSRLGQGKDLTDWNN